MRDDDHANENENEIEIAARYETGERDFSGIDLRRADLGAIDLRGASLLRANLSRANLLQATLGGVDLMGARLARADLREADLSDANLYSADLGEANLSGADLRRANLNGADLRGAKMNGAVLSGAQLIGARLDGADLSWSDLRWANLSGAHLLGANLQGAKLGEADLRRSDLRWTSQRWARLIGADLRGARLGNADLREADLSNANLDRADLIGANLEGATLAAGQLAHTRSLKGATLPDGTTHETSTQRLVVDLSTDTGAIKHGATGFLYGLGKDNIPSVNVLAPLKPQVAAQKPEGGLQHPNGDALNVANTYKTAGGKEIEIYLQDVYQNWPYEMLGLEDYTSKVAQVIRQVIKSPHRDLFSYVPFNEPDQIWYDKRDRMQAFLDDWNSLYNEIKSIHPSARIVGPNFAAYDSDCYRDFLSFARDNHCLPDVISWHELSDDFFPNWYNHYEDYRRIEASLGLGECAGPAAREICINEYCRSSGDLGVPGKLIQWIARLENSKVDSCLAYWTDAGSLNNLVTRDNYNKATGAWWLYKCYGSMTGNTVKTIPPHPTAEGLQGLASVDGTKRQARILLGGCTGDVRIIVTGLDTATAHYFQDRVHVAVWAIEGTGLKPSSGPRLIKETNDTIIDHQLAIDVKSVVETSAYYVVLTPAKASADLARGGFYAAEYAEISGNAKIVYPDSSSAPQIPYVDGYRSSDASTKFVVTADDNAFYKVKLSYSAGPLEGAPTTRRIRVVLNGSWLADAAIPTTGDWDTWREWESDVFLTAGINQIALDAIAGGSQSAIHVRSLELSPGEGPVTTYEAEASQNTLRGTAAVEEDAAASGGKYVGHVGNGEANALEFNHVRVPKDGRYRMVVYFANAEFRGEHSYNSQVVDRHADIRVNGGDSHRVYFRNTFTWDNYQSRVVDVVLQARDNTIEFFNRDPGAYAPNIDRIEIAAPVF
jgi:uncharacterized protein YjbI with pentapeptide repeats